MEETGEEKGRVGRGVARREKKGEVEEAECMRKREGLREAKDRG